ncbi:urease subunit gamma [Nocardioides ginsengisegetis]|uniref:urease subunit gamma n=1 Tax=Nocardioides ginsengisegetis TaxID=661491 RepID=UPI0015FDE23C
MTPRGDHLELFLAAEPGRGRLARGMLPNAPVATALVAHAVVGAARDGVRHAEAVTVPQSMLGRRS